MGLRLVDRLAPFLSGEKRTPEEKRLYAEHQRRWAEKKLLADRTLGGIVMGHSHFAVVSEVEPGRHYVNPGAWFDRGSYAVLTETSAELRHFIPEAPPPHPTTALR